MELGLALDVIVKAAVVGLSLYPLARPGSSHFAGKAMVGGLAVATILWPPTGTPATLFGWS